MNKFGAAVANLTLVLVLALAGLSASCHHAAAPPAAMASAPAAEKSLYLRLGGEPAIKAVVGQFVTNIAADSRIAHYFVDTNLDQLRGSLVNFIGQSTGGPQKYAGRDMKTTHTGLGVSGADFDALVEDLGKALDQFKVGDQEKADLLAVLGPLKQDIVEK
jgi:hemoglobin